MMAAPSRINLTAPGTTTVTASQLNRVVVNTGEAGSSVVLSDADGAIASIVTDDPAVDRVYDLDVRGRILTVVVTGNPDVTVTYV